MVKKTVIKRKNNRLLTGIIGAILLIVVPYLWWLFKPSQVQSAGRGIDCVLAGDGNCVYDLTPEEERLAYGMKRENYSKVLTEILLPNFKSAGRKTEFEKTSDDIIHAFHECITPDGRRVQLASQATYMAEGLKNPQLLTIAFLAATMNENEGGVGAIAKIKNQRSFILKHRDQLEQYGMKGLYRGPDVGLFTWDECIARCDQEISKRETGS